MQLVQQQKKQKLDLEKISNNQLIQSHKRVSDLKSPIVQLEGHSDKVLSLSIDPTKQHIASCSQDKTILLWNLYKDNENYGMMKGHKGAVLEVNWSRDSTKLYSCSTDQQLIIWDLVTGDPIKRHKNSKAIINSLSTNRRGNEMVFALI